MNDDLMTAISIGSQREVIAAYRQALRAPSETDWPAVNRAIIERWSESALGRIKREAWREPEFFGE